MLCCWPRKEERKVNAVRCHNGTLCAQKQPRGLLLAVLRGHNTCGPMHVYKVGQAVLGCLSTDHRMYIQTISDACSTDVSHPPPQGGSFAG